MTANEYTQMRAFARQDGFFLGIMWCVAFACFVYSVDQPALSILYMILIVATPIVLLYRMKSYRNNVIAGRMSYLRAFAFLLIMTSCASLILTIGVYAYFRFLDGGRFMTLMTESISNADVRKSFAEAGIDPSTLDMQLSALAQARPIDMAFSIFSNTLVLSAILDAILALFGKSKTSK